MKECIGMFCVIGGLGLLANNNLDYWELNLIGLGIMLTGVWFLRREA